MSLSVNIGVGAARLMPKISDLLSIRPVSVQRIVLVLMTAANLPAAVPVVSSRTSLTAVPGITIAYQITASESPTFFGATGLPTYWTVDSTNGLVQGRIAQTGTVGSNIVFNVTASNASGTSAAVSVTCAVVAQSLVSQQYRLGSTAAPAPVPFWVSEPVLPDDTVLVTGGRLSGSTIAQLAQLDNGDAGTPAFPRLGFVPWGTVMPGTATSRSLHVGIPAAWSVGMYALRLANGSTNGPPILVNAPDPWFAMGDGGMEVSPGGTLYVSGHCLAYPGRTTMIALVQSGAVAATLAGTSFASDQRGWGYAVTAAMPSVPYGLYEVWLHNGFGGTNGWSKVADPLSVIPTFSWPTATVDFESMSGTNDSAKMTAAMAALPSGGGTILMPARTVNFTASLVLPKTCRLKGQGKAATVLSFAGDCVSPLINGWMYPNHVNRSHFALEDLKIYAPAAFTGIAVQVNLQPAYLPGWMKRVDVQLEAPVPPGGSGNNYVCVWLRQTTDFTMEDCVFDSNVPVRGFDTVFGLRLTRCTMNWRESPLYLYGVTTHVIVDGCAFNIRGDPTTNRWVEFSNPNPGIGFGAFKSGGGSIGGQYIKNVLLSNCIHTRDDHSYAMPGYVGYTSDGENSIYTGPFTASGTALTLPSPTLTNTTGAAAVYDWAGCRASILEGAGAGQHRAVVTGATPGQTVLTIDRPWDVSPDSNSVIDIGCQVGNTLMIANDWSETRLIQLYFNGVNNTVAGGNVGSADGQTTTCCVWSGYHYQGYFPDSQVQFLSANNQYGRVQYINITSTGTSPNTQPHYAGQASFVVRDMRETNGGYVTAKTQSGSGSGTNTVYLPVRDFLIERFPGPLTYSAPADYAGSYAARLVDVTGTTLPTSAVRLADTPYVLYEPTRTIGVRGALAFGNVATGQTATASLTITNSGNVELNVSGVSYPAGFGGAWSGSIASGRATNVTVTFAPLLLQPYGGTVTVSSDATGGTNTLEASGTGISAPAVVPTPATDGTWRTPSTTEYAQTNNWVNGVVAGGAGATLYSFTGTGMVLPVPAMGVGTTIILGNIVVPAEASTTATITLDPGFGAYGHTESLILDSGSAGVPATLLNNCITNAARMKIRSDIRLQSDLFVTYNPTNRWSGPNTAIYLTGNISEDGTRRGLTVSNTVPGNQVALFGDNSFSGDLEVRQGIVRAQAYTRLGGEGHQFGRDNTLIATNAGSQIDLGGFSFGPDQRLLISGCGVGGLGVLAASQQSPCYTSVWSGPITLAGDSAVGMGYHTSYPRKTGSAIALTGTVSDQGAGYKLIKNSQNTLFLRGTNAYSGGTVLSNGYLTATCRGNLGTGPLVFAGGAFLFDTPWDITSSGVALTNAASAVVRLRLAERDVSFSGALGPFGCNVLKSGRGTLTLTRTGTHQNLLICEGAVNLDYTARIEQKLPYAYYVNLYNDGRLNIIGGAQSFTNNVHSVNAIAGCAGVVSISGATGTVFNMEGSGACAANVGAALDLRIQAGTDLNMSRSALDGANMLNSRFTYGGRAFVSKTALSNAIAFASASTNWDNAVSRHMDVTALTLSTVPADARIRTLRFNDPAAGQLTLQGDTGLTNGAILVTAAMGATAVHIQGGTLTSSQGNELIVHQYNTQAVLRISSLLTNTPAGGALILTKTGPGTLILSDVPNAFSGTIYVLGGTLEIESQQAFGATNRQVYVYNGATLRLRGQQTLGVNGTTTVLYANEAGGTVDVPNASDRVTLLGRIGMQSHGLLTKVGKGTLALTNWTQQQNESFLSILCCNYSVEEGSLDIGDAPTVGPRWLGGESPVKVTVKNNAVLRGAGFLYGNGATNGGGSPEDEQGAYLLVVDATGGIVDLHGQSVNMGNVGAETYSCDFLSGPGRLTITNSSATAATVSFNGAHFNRFNGVFDGAKYYTRNVGGGLPVGEFAVPQGAAIDFGWVTFPYAIALGRLTGTGSFGGKCPDNQMQPPLLVGRDADETFEYSGYLWGTYNSIGNSAFPFRYTKVGANTWRISGTTNAMTSDVTVRKGTILVGANSPGNGAVGALGRAGVLLGDSGTAASNNLALLTDGPCTIGNTMALTNANPYGTMTLGGNQTAGASLFTSGLELTRDVVLTSANTDGNGVTFSGAITGPGGITKTGVGTVCLTGAVSNAGPTVVQAGQLVVQSNVMLTNTLTVAAGTAGSGTLAVTGNLTLGPGAQLGLSVAGALNRDQTYTLMTWSGTRVGIFASVAGLSPDWHLRYLSNSLVLYYKPPGTSIGIR